VALTTFNLNSLNPIIWEVIYSFNSLFKKLFIKITENMKCMNIIISRKRTLPIPISFIVVKKISD